MIRDASLSIHDAHGQYIENIHLQPYASEQDFHDDLYDSTYSPLFKKAHAFVKSTGSTPAKTLIIIRFVSLLYLTDPRNPLALIATPFESVAALTLANMNIRTCRGTTGRFRRRSTSASLWMRRPWRRRLPEARSLASWREDIATGPW